jgi:hypothetical protein
LKLRLLGLIWLYGEDGYIAPHHPHGSGRPPVPFELEDKKKNPHRPKAAGALPIQCRY